MDVRRLVSALWSAIVVSSACSAPAPPPRIDGSPSDPIASSRALFEQYERAIQSKRGDWLARFYDVDSVVRVINGSVARTSRAELDSIYRSRWGPPEFFAFEDLSYDMIDSAFVLVTGGFRWLPAGSRDTARYLYAAVLVAADSGMLIRFEHETQRPVR